ncbi:hypothetical protein H5410_060653 [Solanum commersonii]|uniref:Uncharacterized protein n=1 Tax=Solanum commersonii TaxID=4109 RepID=A0A9J5W6A4_SOLCO|nr:hypothetical protein H5410_060653 [Solanum commersonii]
MDSTKHLMYVDIASTCSTRVSTQDQDKRPQSGMYLEVGGIFQHSKSLGKVQAFIRYLTTSVPRDSVLGGYSFFEGYRDVRLKNYANSDKRPRHYCNVDNIPLREGYHFV